MKKLVKISVVCTLLLTAVVYFSCGGGGSSSSFNLFDTAEKATPIVLPSSVASISSANWTSGNTLYEIYQLIRRYNNDTDNGVVDGSNMHKALYEANNYVSTALSGCLTSANDGTVVTDHSITNQAITPPFDFGSDLLTQTYNCAYTVNDTGTPTSGVLTNYTKSFAVKYASGIYYMLMGWYADETTQTTPSVTQLEYDTNTNDIKLNNAYLVNYNDGSSYNVRIYIRGNTATHLFSLKLFKYSTGVNPSIAGYGYSEGTDKYYLFKVTDSNNTTGKYFCIPANATEDDMKAMNDAGDTTVPTLCAGLETGLPTNYNTDGSDSPTTVSKFTGAGTSHIELTWN